MIIVLLLLSIPLIFAYILKRKRRNISTSIYPPGPRGLPIIGNLHQLATAKNPHVYLWKLSKKYGPIMQMKIGSVPIVIISSAQLAKEVLKTNDLVFCSRPKSLGSQKLSYGFSDMTFSTYNDYWKEMRKITAIHLFSSKKIQSFRPIREDEVYRMIEKISGLSSSSHNRSVNLSEISMAMSGSLICRIAFGKRYDYEGSEIHRFDELSREAQALMACFFVSDFFPCFWWVDKISGLMDRLETTFSKLDSFYQELIDDHLHPNRKRTTVDEEDILDTLIRFKEEKFCSIDLHWHHIKALLLDIFVAATDTTAASTVWTLTALIKTPKIMAKVQSQIRDFIGRKGKVEEEDLHNLPYLKAVVSESLRLYPPAPMLVPREAMENCSLDDFEIQSKTIMYINAWAIARDPEYWENPHEFLPERFLNSGIDVKGQDFGVIPFGSGRRICPGMCMGLANVELILANLLYSFDWDCPPGIMPHDIDTDVLGGFTMHKKNPLFLVPKRYTSSLF